MRESLRLQPYYWSFQQRWDFFQRERERDLGSVERRVGLRRRSLAIRSQIPLLRWEGVLQEGLDGTLAYFEALIAASTPNNPDLFFSSIFSAGAGLMVDSVCHPQLILPILLQTFIQKYQKMSDSEQFKSYGKKSQQLDLLQDKMCQPRPTTPAEQKLYQCYIQNAQRKKALLKRILQVEALRRQKAIAQQLLIDREKKLEITEIFDSEEEIELELSEEFRVLEKDYYEKKGILSKLQSTYIVSQSISAKFCVELGMSRNLNLRQLLRSTCQVQKYLYMQSHQVLAILLTCSLGPRLLFRSTRIPSRKILPIKLQNTGYNLSYIGNTIGIVYETYFALYNFETQKMELQSTEHESKIVFLEFIQKEKVLFVVSATREGVVRVYDTGEKVLKGVIICEEAERYAVVGEKLLFSVGNKLNSVNIFTKEFRDVGTVGSPIVFLSPTTLSTQEFSLTDYFSKDTFNPTNKTPDRVITIDNKEATLKQVFGKTIIKLPDRSYQAEAQYICSFTRRSQMQQNQLIILFGAKNGDLYQNPNPIIFQPKPPAPDIQ